MKRIASLIIAVAFCVAASSAVAGSKAVNEKCPLSGKAVDSSKVSTVKVEFCCNNCKGKFEKSPTKFMAKAAKGQEGKCIFSGEDAGASSEVKVAFCCGNCQGKFDKSPKKFLGKLQAKKKKK